MFDTHCHLQTEAFNEDRDNIITEAERAGVSQFLVPAIDHESFSATLALAQSRTNVHCALGIHPHSASQWSNEIRDTIEAEVSTNPKVVAIGEIGIDYHYDFAPKEVQRQAFSEQIQLAQGLRKPIVIHTRESEDDVWRIVEEHYSGVKDDIPKGQFHCFSAGLDLMQKAVSLGFYVSFTGNITFKKSTLGEVVRETPLSSILLETDSPYLAPIPFRGKRNSPVHLRLIAEKVAEIKEIDVAEVMQQTFNNALRLFNIKAVVLLVLVTIAGLWSQEAYGQQKPAGSLPPDSVLTGDRRKSEELRKKQQEELARETEQHRQDSIRTVEREQQEMLVKMREQARVDSVKAAEKIAADERERQRMLTPIAWKAIGLGGSIGIGNMPLILSKPSLTPTSVLATTIELSSFLTRRMDVDLSYSHMVVSDEFRQDSVFNLGSGTSSAFKYNKKAYQPSVRLVNGEDLSINTVSFDIRYTITQPTALMGFYLGIGFTHLTMTNTQRYFNAVDSVNFDPTEHSFTDAFSRNSLKVIFGLRHDFELGGGFIVAPFAEISALGAFAGADQNLAFVFRPDAEQIIMTHVRAGATLYFGWFSVPRVH